MTKESYIKSPVGIIDPRNLYAIASEEIDELFVIAESKDEPDHQSFQRYLCKLWGNIYDFISLHKLVSANEQMKKDGVQKYIREEFELSGI
jgi:hypothetical protein